MTTSVAIKQQFIEIRWHGRDGHETVTSAELVAQVAIFEGRCGQAFYSFGTD